MSVDSSSNMNDILIRTMKLEDYTEVKRFLGGNFYNGEPLCASSGENVQKCYEKEQDEDHFAMIEQGTSLLAIDEQNGGSIVGLILAGAQYPGDLEKHRQEADEMVSNTWGRMCVMASKVELELNFFESYKISKLLYLHIINVDASKRGKGIGTRLVKALMEVGRAQAFPLMTAYCSSFYAARQMEDLGMECAYSLAYADYKDDNGAVVFKPPAPHTHLRIMVTKL